NIGLEMVAKSPADGYTLIAMPNNLSINAPLYGKLPFDPIKDFAPIILIGSSPVFIGVNSSVPVKSVADLIALAKAKPGTLSYASCGNGTPQHLAGELLKAVARIDLTHIPYKGCSLAIADLLSGQVQIGFSTVANFSVHLKSGKINGVAITSKKRSALVPDIPTVAESGLPDYDVDVWFGLLGPGSLPPEIVAKVNADVNKILASPDIRERMLKSFYEPIGGTPGQFAALIQSDLVRFGKLIRDVGIKVD
ncbi:MAG: tripartite tricarboxylate transporter substrate binding protein, partial [Pyrinomonadaceae bacterium]|nr:tripartite tricarboxylate transporter substrate binding protein [Phycisphaerales bacterium]